jgi:F0F1-type ATP synthase assembly protein I
MSAKVKVSLDKKGDLIKNQINKNNNGDKFVGKFIYSIELAGQLGLGIAIPLIAGAIFGSYLDGIYGTKPKLTLVLILFGLVSSMYYFYKIIQKITKE